MSFVNKILIITINDKKKKKKFLTQFKNICQYTAKNISLFQVYYTVKPVLSGHLKSALYKTGDLLKEVNFI